MSSVFIGHYSEIGLKGKNRGFFEGYLRDNIKTAIRKSDAALKPQISVIDKRMIIKFKDEVNKDLVYDALHTVFGLANFGQALVSASDIVTIEEVALKELSSCSFNSFAIRAKRAYKGFPYNSQQVNIRIGASVVEKLNKRVDLTHPDLVCHIEILKDEAYILVEKIKGPGGLPVGSSGRVTALLSGGFDSPIASYFLLKRGARVDFVHFHSFPYTKATSQEKVKDLASVLNKYQGAARLFMVPFSDLQEEILTNCPDRLRIILYRRFMMRITEKIARRHRSKALVSGESLGQVASQTLANMGVVAEVATLPVLRPLIGLDKNEIMDIARQIGTYEISALPHDDACTRFMPKHPIIYAKLPDVLESEKRLDVNALVHEALKQTERLAI